MPGGARNYEAPPQKGCHGSQKGNQKGDAIGGSQEEVQASHRTKDDSSYETEDDYQDGGRNERAISEYGQWPGNVPLLIKRQRCHRREGHEIQIHRTPEPDNAQEHMEPLDDNQKPHRLFSSFLFALQQTRFCLTSWSRSERRVPEDGHWVPRTDPGRSCVPCHSRARRGTIRHRGCVPSCSAAPDEQHHSARELSGASARELPAY